MTDDEVLEYLDSCLNELGDNPGTFLLVKPEAATEEQWVAALEEYGVESSCESKK